MPELDAHNEAEWLYLVNKSVTTHAPQNPNTLAAETLLRKQTDT